LRDIEPNGEKCYYANKKTKTGGILPEDNTTGFGPEHYTTAKMVKGEYLIQANMFSTHQKGHVPTIVNVDVTKDAGGPNEHHILYTVRLRKDGETVDVCRVSR
jgi:uncharacterized protein YfaP (DUF2135 family)